MIRKICKPALLFAVMTCTLITFSASAQTLEEAITYTKNEQYDKAESMFQGLVKDDPSNSKIYFYYGENTLLNYFSDTISNSLSIATKDAKALFDKGVEVNASEPLNYIGLAKTAYYLKDDVRAEELREKAFSLLPKYKKITKIANPKGYAFTLAKIAESYIRFEDVDSARALPYIRHALSIDPRNSETYIIAGDIYMLVNDASKAIKNYNLAQDWDLQSPTANMKIGNIYVKAKSLTYAIPYFEEAISLNKDYAPAYRELGQLYLLAGKFNDSKKYFEKYLELTKGNIPAKIRYVNALFYAREYSEVIKNVEEIFAVDNSRTYMNRIAGYSAYEEGDYDLAFNYMNKLFDNLQSDRIIKKDYLYYARILIKKNQNHAKLVIDTEKEKASLEKLGDRYSSMKPGTAKDNAKVNLDGLHAKVDEATAKIAEEEKELDKAFESYDKAIGFDNGFDTGLAIEKASFQAMNRRYDDAGATWTLLLENGRDSESDYIQAGRTYYIGKNYDKAEETFNRMTEKYPDNIQGYMWLANTASAKDPEAELGLAKPRFITLLRKAAVDSVKNSQEMFDAMRYLGYNALKNNNYDEAKAYYQRMLNLAPDNQDFVIKAYGSMGTLYLQMGDYGKAIESNNKILALEPDNGSARSAIQYINQLIAGAKPKADPNQITGIIRDDAGQPIANASVRVKDTACEGWTNSNGEYKFVMPESSEVLLISAKGYKTIELPVTKARVYNATLEK